MRAQASAFGAVLLPFEQAAFMIDGGAAHGNGQRAVSISARCTAWIARISSSSLSLGEFRVGISMDSGVDRLSISHSTSCDALGQLFGFVRERLDLVARQ